MKFGPANSNWRGGAYSAHDTDSTVGIAIAKDRLNTILKTKFESPEWKAFSKAEIDWATNFIQCFMSGSDVPDWAITVLKANGFKTS